MAYRVFVPPFWSFSSNFEPLCTPCTPSQAYHDYPNYITHNNQFLYMSFSFGMEILLSTPMTPLLKSVISASTFGS